MSINWVMLTPPTANTTTGLHSQPQPKTPFVLLPSEQILHTTPARTSLVLQTPSTYPGKTPFHLNSPSGTAYLTNRRIVYLPSAPTAALASFAAPLTHIHDSRVTTPWLGPNAWVAVVQAVSGGGLPAGVAGIEAKVTFKEGGAYDFHTKFCMVKERLAQVLEARALSGAGDASLGGPGVAGLVDDDVHLEQLPAYEEVGSGAGAGIGAGAREPRGIYAASNPTAPSPNFPQPQQQNQSHSLASTATAPQATNAPPATAAPTNTTAATATMTTTEASSAAGAPSPAEPPPGYEETQRDNVTDRLERGLRYRGNNRGDGGVDE